MTDITLTEVRGDTIPWRIAVTRDNTALNISGATFRFTARRWKNDTIALVEKDNTAFEISDASGGIVILTLEPEDTSWITDAIALNYDVEMTESDGRVTTIAKGILNIQMDISR